MTDINVVSRLENQVSVILVHNPRVSEMFRHNWILLPSKIITSTVHALMSSVYVRGLLSYMLSPFLVKLPHAHQGHIGRGAVEGARPLKNNPPMLFHVGPVCK